MSLNKRSYDSDFGVVSQNISLPVTDRHNGNALLEEYYARGQYQEAKRSAEVNV